MNPKQIKKHKLLYTAGDFHQGSIIGDDDVMTIVPHAECDCVACKAKKRQAAKKYDRFVKKATDYAAKLKKAQEMDRVIITAVQEEPKEPKEPKVFAEILPNPRSTWGKKIKAQLQAKGH